YDSFENGDKRQSLILPTYTSKTGAAVNLRSSDIGALPLKYAEDPNNPGQWAGNDFIHLRYADVLLCRAEILNEINGPTQESVDLINQVRNRAFDDYYNSSHVKRLSDFADQTALRDYILKERGWELWCEGVRREDLLRHGTYLDVARSAGANRVSEKNLLFPIPTDALIENPIIGQNPYYND
ncbi:MAG: RagB/SusD family nutrient uptake outer membrane protein, partial [Candidatus Symbiothrix sp.]|nr:RagB/SusD family nutrient uptake outer membrane protein [Candidatus Symbiothrix sp.]